MARSVQIYTFNLLQRAAEKALTAPLRRGEGEAHVALGGARLATRDDDVERPAHVALDQRRDRLAHTHKVGAPHRPDGDQGVPGPEGVRSGSGSGSGLG